MRTLIAVLSTVAVASTAYAAPQTFDGIGRVAISGGDRVKARDRALDEACQHAVEAAVASLLGADTLGKRASDMRLKILPRARSYVTTYRVLDSGEQEPGFFSLHVSADVAVDRLVRELQGPALPKLAPGAVRVGLCVRGTSDVATLPRLETALRARLEGQELVVVPSACVGDLGLRATLFAEIAAGELSPIRGTALVGREAELTLRLVEPEGRKGVEAHAKGAGFGGTPDVALDDAGLAALGEAGLTIDQALSALSPKSSTSGLVIVRVPNARRFAQLTNVREALQRIPGVDSVSYRRFAPAGGAVELGVRTSQPEHAIFEALGRVASTYALRPHEQEGAIVVEVADLSDATTPGGSR